MSKASAPTLLRGFSWGLLVVSGLGWVAAAPGQAPATRPAAPAATKANDSKAKGDDTKAGDADEKGDQSVAPADERFIDPNAKATMAIFNPTLYRGERIRLTGGGNDQSRVQNMAGGTENVDPDLVKRYVDYFAAELTKKDNINAIIITPPANAKPDAARGMEKAVEALSNPLVVARANNNTGFLNSYSRVLFESALPKLLADNYFTRVNAMIVLGMAGSTSRDALDLYNRELKNKDQLIWVKMWAAHGLTNAAQEGRNSLDASRANLAADALVSFLNSSPDLPYFALCRTLEALGSIRVAIVNQPTLKVDVASTIAGQLANTKARVEIRAWAAWALGMLRVSGQVNPYNFALIGHDVGRLAADLGTKIIAEYDADPDSFDGSGKDQAASLAALLLFQVVPALAGEESIGDSGLLRSSHPAIGAVKPTLVKIDELIKGVAREAYELLRAGGVGQKKERDELAARVADLRTFLDANKPKTRRLVPDGPTLPDPATR